MTLGRDFLPYLDEGSIWLQVELPPGISLAKGSEMAAQLRQVVRQFPEVSYVVTQLGRNEDGTDPWTPSHIEASVGLKPYDEWGGDKQALIRRMDARFQRMPGYQIAFSQPMIDGVQDMIAGAHSQLVVRIFGDDFRETRRIAEQVRDVLAAIPGAADPAIDQEPPLPQLQIVVDRAAAARYGINVSDIADLIQTAIGGQALSQVFLGARRYDVTVRFADYARNSPAAIGDLQLVTASGARIPLSQVASIRDDAGESTITHEMGRRHLTVKLDLRGRDLATFITQAKKAIEARVPYDRQRYAVAWGGEFENQQRAQARLLDHRAGGARPHLRAAVRPVQRHRAGGTHPAQHPAGPLGRRAGATSSRHDAQCVERGRLYRFVWRRGAERGDHGGEPEPLADDRRRVARRRGDGWCRRTVAPRPHDGYGRNAWAHAGGAGARGG